MYVVTSPKYRISITNKTKFPVSDLIVESFVGHFYVSSREKLEKLYKNFIEFLKKKCEYLKKDYAKLPENFHRIACI